MIGLFLIFVCLCTLSVAAVYLGVLEMALKILLLIIFVMVGTYLFMGLIGLFAKWDKEEKEKK